MPSVFTKNFLYALVILCGPLNFGFVMGFTSPAIPEFTKNWNISTFQTTTFNAISSLFAIGGPFIATFLLKKFGRKETTSIISASTFLFWGLLTLMTKKSFGFGIFIRAMLGLSIGAYSSLAPMMLVEIASKDQTGFYGGMNQCGIVIGIIIMYLQGTGSSWSSLCITGVVISVLQTIFIWFIPETGSKGNDEVQKTASESLWQKKYTQKLLVGLLMMFFQQFCGVNALITNLDSQFASAGVPVKSGIASAISVSSQLIAVCIGSALVDKFGRRQLWCISTAGCSICLFVYAINEAGKIANWIPIVVIFLYMFFFGIAMGPVPWFIIPELFPDSVRSLASSFISMSNWIFAFAVIFLYPLIINAIGNIWALIVFGIITGGGCVYGYFYITEPSQSTFDDSANGQYKSQVDVEEAAPTPLIQKHQNTDDVVRNNSTGCSYNQPSNHFVDNQEELEISAPPIAEIP